MAFDRISRRDVALSGMAAAAAAAAGLSVDGIASRARADVLKSGTRPNIVFITMDELRFDALGCAGNAHIKTPNIDALAARGTRFSHTYTQGPLCQPARASLITGQYVKQTGQGWNGFDMKPEWPTMMKALQTNGYTTAMLGKTHFFGRGKIYAGREPEHLDMRTMTPWCQQFGLDYLLEEFDHNVHKNPKVTTPYTEYLKSKGLLDLYRTELPGAGGVNGTPEWEGHLSHLSDDDQLSAFLGNHAIDWVNGHGTDKPFFLWVSFIEPHPPLTDAVVWDDLYKDADIPTGTRQLPDLPDNAWGKYLRASMTQTKSMNMTDADALQMARRYYALVSQVDHRIGMIVKDVEDRGLGSNTWFVFSADHGDMLGQHNLVYKKVFYAGSVRVPNIIVPPGGMPPRVVDAPVESIDITATIMDISGASLPSAKGQSLAAMLNGAGKPREVVHSELANTGNALVMAATTRYRYTYDTLNKIACELFDLKHDPDEMHNLVLDPSHAGVMSDLHKDYIQPFTEA